jgi:hypothetical protein
MQTHPGANSSWTGSFSRIPPLKVKIHLYTFHKVAISLYGELTHSDQ